MTVVNIDTSSEVSVTNYLTRARDWLATCVEMTGPEQIAAAKAEIATAAEATKQLNLSKEIQLDAQEMVRRAEFKLGKAIRKGQAEGRIAKQGNNIHDLDLVDNKVYDFVTPSEWHGNRGAGATGISELAQIDDLAIDDALEKAKAEGNLSRANVVRKVKKQAGPTTRDQRADLIADLAAQGYSSRQMPEQVGVTEETVRQIARDFDIEIPADKVVGRTRRINSTSVVENTVTALEGLVMGVELIDFDALNPTEARQWATSLTDSLRVLNRFAKQIKEMTQ